MIVDDAEDPTWKRVGTREWGVTAWPKWEWAVGLADIFEALPLAARRTPARARCSSPPSVRPGRTRRAVDPERRFLGGVRQPGHHNYSGVGLG